MNHLDEKYFCAWISLTWKIVSEYDDYHYYISYEAFFIIHDFFFVGFLSWIVITRNVVTKKFET